MAGVGGLELRNVVANYPFERSNRFPGIQPNSGRRDCSRLSCHGGRRSSGLVPGAECLRWQELPRFSADAEMIRRWRKMNWLLPGSCCARKQNGASGIRSSGLVPGAERLRWQELPRFPADPEMIRLRPIQQHHCTLCAGLSAQSLCLLAGAVSLPQ